MDRTALFDRLEAHGGTLVARNKRAGTFAVLGEGDVEEGGRTVVGYIPLAAAGRGGDALADRGWELTDRGYEREWPDRGALHRVAILRDVDQALDILAGPHGLTHRDFPLAHVSPIGSDSGYAQVGWVVAPLSALIGDALGTIALLFLHPDWLFGRDEPIATTVIGLLGGWVVAVIVAVIASLVVVGLGVMSVVERVPRLSRASGDIYLALMILVPAVVAAVTLWIAASANR